MDIVQTAGGKSNFVSFEMGPIDAAYAREFANSLRRVLLASLPGAAITSLYGALRVGQILEMDEEHLITIRNFGQKGLQELCECMQKKGLLPKQGLEKE